MSASTDWLPFPYWGDGDFESLTSEDARRLFYLVARAILSLEMIAEHSDGEFIHYLGAALHRFEELHGSKLSPKST